MEEDRDILAVVRELFSLEADEAQGQQDDGEGLHFGNQDVVMLYAMLSGREIKRCICQIRGHVAIPHNPSYICCSCMIFAIGLL